MNTFVIRQYLHFDLLNVALGFLVVKALHWATEGARNRYRYWLETGA